MTAIAIVCAPASGIVIASDGAAYDDDGVLRQVHPKVELYPHMSCAIGARGAGPANGYVKEWLTAYGISDHAQVLLRLPDAARDAARHLDLSDYPHERHFSLFVCGWSEERQEFETHVLRSRESTGAAEDGSAKTIPPFTIHPLPWIHFAPPPYDDAAEHCGLEHPELVATKAEPLDAVSYAVRAVCAARAARFPPELDGRRFYGVGGFIQVTTVQRDTITTTIVHRWPDQVGEVLDGTAGELMPLFLTAGLPAP